VPLLGLGKAALPAPRPLVSLTEHPDQHGTQYPVLLAVDQQLGEGAALWVTPEFPDPVSPVEVRQHEDVEQLGAGSWSERIEAFSEFSLELIGSHRGSLRCHEVSPRRRIYGRVTGFIFTYSVPVSTPEDCGRTLVHMAASFLILLIYVAVMAAVLYLAVRFGVRDGMTDFENRRGPDPRR
jgi:hypothetical protein